VGAKREVIIEAFREAIARRRPYWGEGNED